MMIMMMMITIIIIITSSSSMGILTIVIKRLLPMSASHGRVLMYSVTDFYASGTKYILAYV